MVLSVDVNWVDTDISVVEVIASSHSVLPAHRSSIIPALLGACNSLDMTPMMAWNLPLLVLVFVAPVRIFEHDHEQRARRSFLGSLAPFRRCSGHALPDKP
jgi:hypothetical protein